MADEHVVLVGDHGVDRGDIDDLAVAALPHAGHDVLADVEDALDIGVEGAVPVGVREGVDAAAHGHPRVVQEDVNAPVGVNDRVDGGPAAVLVGDVAAYGDGVVPGGLDLRLEGLQAIQTPGEQRDVGAVLGVGAGGVGAEPRARPDNDGDLPAEVKGTAHGAAHGGVLSYLACGNVPATRRRGGGALVTMVPGRPGPGKGPRTRFVPWSGT